MGQISLLLLSGCCMALAFVHGSFSVCTYNSNNIDDDDHNNNKNNSNDSSRRRQQQQQQYIDWNFGSLGWLFVHECMIEIEHSIVAKLVLTVMRKPIMYVAQTG